MEWKELIGKKVFIKTKSSGVYNGNVTDVDISSLPLIWITIIDKYGNNVMFEHSEIIKLEEQA